MKKHFVKKMSLSRETLRRLEGGFLAGVAGGTEVQAGDVAVDKNLSINPCTNVISDCLGCTTPLASCPKTFQTCTCA